MGYLNETKKVWLILNSSAIKATLKLDLENKGYKIGQLELNGRGSSLPPESEMVKEIEDFKPDLVLLNVNGVDSLGFELCRQIKASSQLAGLRVILFGSEPGRATIMKAYQIGASYYVGVLAEDYSILLGLVDKVLTTPPYSSQE